MSLSWGVKQNKNLPTASTTVNFSSKHRDHFNSVISRHICPRRLWQPIYQVIIKLWGINISLTVPLMMSFFCLRGHRKNSIISPDYQAP